MMKRSDYVPANKKLFAPRLDADTCRRIITEFLSRHPRPVGAAYLANPGLLRVAIRRLGDDEVNSLCNLGLMSAAHLNGSDPENPLCIKFAVQRMMGQLGNALRTLRKFSRWMPSEWYESAEGGLNPGLKTTPDTSSAADGSEALSRFYALPGDEREVIRLRLGLEDDRLTFAQIAKRLGCKTAEAEETYQRGIDRCRGRWEEATTASAVEHIRSENAEFGYSGVVKNHASKNHNGGYLGRAYKTITVSGCCGTPRGAAAELVAFYRRHHGRRWKEYFDCRMSRGWVAMKVAGGWLVRAHVVCRGDGDEVRERVAVIARGPDGVAVEAVRTPGARPARTKSDAVEMVNEWMDRTFGKMAAVRVRRYWTPKEPDRRKGAFAPSAPHSREQ